MLFNYAVFVSVALLVCDSLNDYVFDVFYNFFDVRFNMEKTWVHVLVAILSSGFSYLVMCVLFSYSVGIVWDYELIPVQI